MRHDTFLRRPDCFALRLPSDRVRLQRLLIQGCRTRSSTYLFRDRKPAVKTSTFFKSPKLVLLGLAAIFTWHLGTPLLGEALAKETGRSDFPEQISSVGEQPRQNLGKLIKGTKGKEIQDCSRKCIPTCLRGGEGAPGLGPMTVRKDLVVFKEGFRDRKYCLTECTSVCAISYLGQGASSTGK